MDIHKERILLVENDPEINDLISRQALQPLGYLVSIVSDASQAIQQVIKFTPDLIISNINLPGLSGKDLLVALNSQGIQIPLVVLAEKGQENNVIQAFRLGASDYILWPARDVEVISVVERNLKQVRAGFARQQLDQKLKNANQELEARVRELTTILAIGKSVISIRDQAVLLDRLVEGAVYMSEADFGWILLLNEKTNGYELAAHRNLPDGWANRMGKSMDDGISSLVTQSGESLVINGESLSRFSISSLGNSAAAVPIKVDHNVIGIFVIVRKKDAPIKKSTQSLLEAVADYASISLVNARLFRALQQTAAAARQGEKKNLDLLARLLMDIQKQFQPITAPLDFLQSTRLGELNIEQKKALGEIQNAFGNIVKLVENKQAGLGFGSHSEGN